MAEYIERELILDAIAKDHGKRDDIQEKVALDIWDKIKKIPSADVVEVRHGHWIESDNLESFNTRGWKRYKKVICSHCKKSNYNNHSNYCPNCGAKMDGKDGADNE